MEVTAMVGEATGVVELVVLGALVVISALCVVCGYRVIRGPTIPDRVIAIDAIATNVVAISVLFAVLTGRGIFVTVGLVLAIIGFIATVTVAKFIVDGDVIG